MITVAKRGRTLDARERWFSMLWLVETIADDDVFIFRRLPGESRVWCLVEVLASLRVPGSPRIWVSQVAKP